MLAATADGRKLLPMLILKRKTTQIRGVSEGRFSQGPGKRMADGKADVGVAENSMDL
jgi:hypothetical protein